MNKNELIAKIAAREGLTKAQAGRIVECTLESIVETVDAGDEVALSGFGKFKLVEKAGRTGRNPQTGAAVEIPAKRAIKFAPSSTLKKRLN